MNGIIKRAGVAAQILVGVLSLSTDNAEAALAPPKLISVRFVPAQPRVGEAVTAFFTLETSFAKEEPVFAAIFNGNDIGVQKAASKLWAVHFQPFTEVKSHDLVVSLSLRNEKEAIRIRQASNALRQEILDLDAAILAELDPGKKAELEALRDQKIAYQLKLENDLEALKIFVKSETYHFDVAADPTNVDFPTITGVTPNSAPLGKRVKVVIAGQNFLADPKVKFGDQNATVLSATATSIEVLAPNFSEKGLKKLEVRFLPEKKNALASESFFVSDRSLLQNERPVAVTTGYLRQTLPATGQLVASNSYDPNPGDTFAYDWEVLAVPPTSTIVVGTLLANSATPTFAPDKVGIYRVRLRIRETNTEEEFLSFPSYYTIEVK